MRKIISALLSIAFIAITALDVYGVDAPASGNIKSVTAVLIDAKTGQVLYDKDKDKRMYPASTTKILTGLLAVQNGNMSDVLTTSYNAVHSLPRKTSHIALDTDEQITLEQAMYGMGIESANDAANVIAEKIGGTNEQFAFLMNDYAMQLGAVNSNFTNPHGLPDDNHYTTAYDLALITTAAVKHPQIYDFFGTRRYDIPPTNKKAETRQFWNANYFLNNEVPYDKILMSKTGWTEEAGHTLVTVATRNGMTLIAVVMSSTHQIDKYNDTVALFDYGFSNFEQATISTQNLVGGLPTEFTQEGEQSILLEAGSFVSDTFSALLPIGADLAGISIAQGQPTLQENGRLSDIPLTVSYTQGETVMELGKTNVTAIVAEPPEAPVSFQTKLFDFAKKPTFIILNILMWLVLAFFAWLVIRRIIILQRRKRRKRRKLMRQNAAKYNRATHPVQQDRRVQQQGTRPKQKLTKQQIQQRHAQRMKSQIYKD